MNMWRLLFFILFLITEKPLLAEDSFSPAMRDPFSLKREEQKTTKIVAITLEGIVYSGKKRCAAILARGDNREIVECGEKFEGYTLNMIGKNFVTLINGKDKKKLVID